MSLYLGENLISGSKPINLGVRNIGEIFPASLPITDAGAHLLDGGLILGGGIYQGFVDYIADLYAENPSANYFTTEALWQQSVTTYGVCGKFVYDSVNNTVRLPKITGIIEGTTDVSALGDLVEAGLPNITGYINGAVFDTYMSTQDPTSALYRTRDYSTEGAGGGGYVNGDYAFDASRSNSTYGNSSTVQPQTIKVLYYIVVATTSKTEIQSDIDEIATDLNGKADTDLSNCTNVASTKMAHNAMPSNTYTDLTVGASGTSYTAPADGYFYAFSACSNNGYNDLSIRIGGSTFMNQTRGDISFSDNTYSALEVSLPVIKNEIVTISWSNATNIHIRFFYANGSESEAN